MKRIFFAIMMMALGLTVNAETTDITSIDNVLYINDVTADAGKQAKLSVKMKNTVLVQTIGVYVTMPEGVTVATNARGQYMIALSNERTDSDCHSLSKSCVDGVYRVGILGTAGLPFDGNDGEVFTITVNIPEDMLAGDYTIEMTEMELTDTSNKSYTTESVKSTLTVQSTATGISSVSIDDASNIYNISGQARETMQHGVNILKENRGSRKIIKK